MHPPVWRLAWEGPVWQGSPNVLHAAAQTFSESAKTQTCLSARPQKTRGPASRQTVGFELFALHESTSLFIISGNP